MAEAVLERVEIPNTPIIEESLINQIPRPEIVKPRTVILNNSPKTSFSLDRYEVYSGFLITLNPTISPLRYVQQLELFPAAVFATLKEEELVLV